MRLGCICGRIGGAFTPSPAAHRGFDACYVDMFVYELQIKTSPATGPR